MTERGLSAKVQARQVVVGDWGDPALLEETDEADG